MELLCAATGTDWSQESEERPEVKPTRDTFLRELLLAEHLVVLTGLGTSLCVVDDNGGPLAPTMGDLWRAVEALTAERFEAVIEAVRYDRANGENIEALLSQCQVSESYHSRQEVAAFIRAAEQEIAARCRFVSAATNLRHHTTFLRKVARRPARQPRMKLFTTNYDLCFEYASAQTQFVVIDGFSHTLPQRFDGINFSYDLVRREDDREAPDYIPNAFHLYKLHGSVDWHPDRGSVLKDLNTRQPAIIYPRHSKFESSYEQPYLEMMSRFQMAVRQPNTGVLIVGFGFNDRHIVQPIMAAMRSNISLRLLVVSPDLKHKADPGHEKYNADLGEVKRLIAAGDPRLGMLAASFEELVQAIPDLVAKTEAELHQDRVFGGGRQ